MEKLDLRTLGKEAKLAIRQRAIHLHKRGLTQLEIADLLGVNRNSVYLWCKKYKISGKKGLQETPRGHKLGEGRIFTIEQEKIIQEMIIDTMPEQLKLPYGLWTRKAIKELIKREFKVSIAIRTMGDYLNRWGFTPQKPKKKAYEQCAKKVQKWLKEEYPAIKKQAKQEGAEIHWGDETGMRNESQYGRSYAPKGKTPIREKLAKRLSFNMISTVTNQGKVRFMIYNRTMTSQLFIQFLKRLIKGSNNKIYLILDNLRVHHSKLVKKWVEEHRNEIELFYLPSYSPERNPDEYLNCDLKLSLSNKPSPKNETQLKTNLNSHMRALQKNKAKVANYFKHESINYAA